MTSAWPWPLTKKIKSVHPWVQLNICNKFEKIESGHWWDIVFMGRRDGPTTQKHKASGHWLLWFNETNSLENKCLVVSFLISHIHSDVYSLSTTLLQAKRKKLHIFKDRKSKQRKILSHLSWAVFLSLLLLSKSIKLIHLTKTTWRCKYFQQDLLN